MLALSWFWRSTAQRCKTAFRSPWLWAIVGVTLAGLWLRAFHLGSSSLWYDEAFSALAAEQPFDRMLNAIGYDVHPPAYFALLWAWVRLWPGAGRPSEWWLRLPSLLFSTAAVPLTWLLAKKFLLGDKAALLAAALMAMLPFQVFYGQETRQYSMLLFASLVTMLCWRTGKWQGVCVGLILAAYTQNVGLLWAACLSLIVLAFDRANWTRMLWADLGLGLAYLPWAFRLLQQVRELGTVGYWLPQVTLGGFPYLFHALLWNDHTTDAVVLPGMLLSATLLGLALWAAAFKMPRRAIWLSLLLLLPLAAALASLLASPIFIPRALIAVSPVFYILTAVGLVNLKPLPRWTLITALVVTLVVSLAGYYFSPRLQKWDHHSFSRVITDGWHDGDVVLCASKCLPFIWYLDNKPVYTLPDVDDRLHCTLSPGTIDALAIQETLPEPLDGRYRRMWFVWTVDPSTTQYQIDTRDRLRAHWPVLFDQTFIMSRLAEGTITLHDMETTWTSWTR